MTASMLTFQDLAKIYPSFQQEIDQGRVVIKNSMPRELVKNINISPPTGIKGKGHTEQKGPQIPQAAKDVGLEVAGVYRDISLAWMSKERAEKTILRDHAQIAIACFKPAFDEQQKAKSKTQNSAAAKKGDDVYAHISTRWQD